MKKILASIVYIFAMSLACGVNAESGECASAKRMLSFHVGSKKSTYEEKRKAKNDVKVACGTSSESSDTEKNSEKNESVQQETPTTTILVNCEQAGCWGTNGTWYTNVGGGNYINSRTGQVVRP